MDGMYAFNLAWANGSSGRYNSERNATINAGGSIYIPSVHPGWDETKVAARDNRPNPTSTRNRANGQFLANSFNGAVVSGADVIMIGSWNEYDTLRGTWNQKRKIEHFYSICNVLCSN